MTQPTLSDHVKRLEQRYDVLLFRREGRAAHLTDAGEALFRLTNAYFEVEGRIAAHLDASGAAVEGRLRIVADSALHITKAVAQFRNAHPKVFVSIHAGNSDDVLARVRAYEAEIGIAGALDAGADLDVTPLGASPIVAIARKGDLPPGTRTLSFAELAKHPLIFRESGSRTRDAVEEAARQAGVTLLPSLVVEGREAMREVVASGAGLGFVSLAELGADPRVVSLAITGARLAMPEALVMLRSRVDVPVIRAFRRVVERMDL